MRKIEKRERFLWLLFLLFSLFTGGRVLADPLPASIRPDRAIILRDGGTILIDLDPEGRLRYDQRYGSPTRGEFFYEPPGAPERPLSLNELKRIYPALKRREVKNGKEYYDTFVQALGKKIKAKGVR
ncbi:MAG TPA: hypothetical protein DD435_04195 [Cyanobacteria bacterium UBA8530]|nr:hypothetical protein [Cyanobacteria bacterium UBA8530]